MSDFEWRRVYADCAASSPVLPQVYNNMHGYQANPNSAHQYGRISRGMLEKARADIAECIGADRPSEIAFTPSATAACHYAIDTLAIGQCSEFEHKAVFDYVNEIRLWDLASSFSCAHILVNNETGERYDETVKGDAKHYRVFTDATAAVGQIPVDVKELGVEALAAGAHKFGGYPGIGFVYIKGGASDDDTYPGTPPVALACAMADALKYRVEHMEEAKQYLEHNISALSVNLLGIGGFSLSTPWGYNVHVPNILSVRFDGINARQLLVALDALGVYASAGAACSADSDEPSRSLLASGLTKEQALSTIRLSFCPETKEEDFAYVALAVRRAVAQLRQLSV